MMNVICPEDTCGHTTCLLWWNTQAIKYSFNHRRDVHRLEECDICQRIEAARTQPRQ